MGLLQRVFDQHGLATVSITQVREITELVKPSLACLVEHPFGLTLGATGDHTTHRSVLHACLTEAAAPHPAGAIIDLGFRWELDDLRDRQLRKRAR